MKNITLLCFLVSATVTAQLFVGSNSYVYSKGDVVYVTQGVNLQNNGNFYLRDEAQLLQGTNGISTNTGLGRLSVFQEGTSDNFDYNYWCSPVGNASAGSGNESFGITMLNRPTGPTSSTAATMLAMAALDGTSTPLAIAPRWTYKYINSNTYSQWVLVGTATSLAPGEGFTMKGTSGTDALTLDGVQNNPGGRQRYDFRGKPNDGNITVTVGANNQTLTGNPYPSALHVNAFLLDASNVACDGIAYYWEQNKTVDSHFLAEYQGGYGTYSPIDVGSSGIYLPAAFNTYDGNGDLNTAGTSSGLVIARKYAPIGQGFMIKGQTNGTVTIKNSHRVFYKESSTPLSFFERTSGNPESENAYAEPLPHLRINTIFNNQFTRQLALAFPAGATDGVDRGIDARSPEDGSLPNDVYFLLNHERFVIQGLPFDLTKRVPLGLRSAANASFRFYLAESVDFPEGIPVYVYDALDGSYHNIRNDFYDVALEAGTHENRFEITFMDAALGLNDHGVQGIDTYQDNAAQSLVISNPQHLTITSCNLYDLTGKLVRDENKLGSDSVYRISTTGLSEGVYIVRITTPMGAFAKKISVVQKRN